MKFKTLLSLKSLIVLAFAAAAIPLFLGVSYAAFGLRESAELGKKINSQVFEQTKIIRLVLQQSSDIERKARLFVLLSDPSLRQPYERKSYEAARVSFKQSLSDLLKLHVDNKIALLANELAEKENLIYEQIIGSESEDSFKLPIDEAFIGFREASNTLSHEFENHVEDTLDDLGQFSQSLELGLITKGAVLLFFVFGIVLVLLRFITKSTRQLDTAICRLSAGEFLQPVTVNGPSDLKYMGSHLESLRTHLLEAETASQKAMRRLARDIEQPLATLHNNLEKLDSQDGPVVDQLKTALQTLHAVSEPLSRYSQCLEIPTAEVWQTLDMQTLLDNCLKRFTKQIDAKSINIDKQTQSVEFDGIERHYTSIIEALLDNAIRFSPADGEIRLTLRDNGDDMVLEIEDDGPGIKPEQRLLVFEPFFQGDTDGSTIAQRNCGLGLTLVKAYVNHLRGRVEFIDPSQKHHGARIRLRLPLAIND